MICDTYLVDPLADQQICIKETETQLSQCQYQLVKLYSYFIRLGGRWGRGDRVEMGRGDEDRGILELNFHFFTAE